MHKVLLVGPSSKHSLQRFVAACNANQFSAHVVIKDDIGLDVDLCGAAAVQIIESFAHIDELIATAKNEGYLGIVPAYEGTVEVAEQLASALNLPGNGAEDPSVYRNKRFMRESFEREGVSQPRVFGIFTSIQQAESFDWGTVSFPVIVKPVDGVASFYVRKCDNPSEVLAHLPLVLSHRRAKATGIPSYCAAIVEELVGGTEYSAECIVVDGRLVDFFVVEKFVSQYPDCDETGHLCRTNVPINLDEVRSNLEKVVRAWKIGSSVLHAEFKIDSDGFKLIEVGNRVCGDRISELIQRLHGWHLEEVLIRLRCNIDFTAAYKNNLTERFPVYGTKFFYHDEFIPTHDPEIVILDSDLDSEFSSQAKKNDAYGKYHLLNRTGYVLFAAKDYQTALSYMQSR